MIKIPKSIPFIKGEVGKLFHGVEIPVMTKEQEDMLADIHMETVHEGNCWIEYKVKDGVIYVHKVDVKDIYKENKDE